MTAPSDTTGKRLLGFGTGLVFGALLQRGRLSRYDAILGQLLFQDGRVAKAMATADALGAIGVHALVRRGLIKKTVKPMKVGGIVLGGILFGTGLAILGYCPGTSVAAVGGGRKDAFAGVLGMLLGAGAFVRLYPVLEPLIEAGGDFGKVTLRRRGPAMKDDGCSSGTPHLGFNGARVPADRETSQHPLSSPAGAG